MLVSCAATLSRSFSIFLAFLDPRLIIGLSLSHEGLPGETPIPFRIPRLWLSPISVHQQSPGASHQCVLLHNQVRVHFDVDWQTSRPMRCHSSCEL